MKKNEPEGKHIQGFQKEIDLAAKKSSEAFFTYFDSAADTNSAFIRGVWDFALHVALPIAPYIRSPELLTCLEIGHGGGRLVAAACTSFAEVIGIDVHNQNNLVKEELSSRGIKNFRLYKTDSQAIPLPNSSIDVAFSFIVLQHIEKVDTFEAYVDETFRVMKNDRIAILYFSRGAKWSEGNNNKTLYMLDNISENFRYPKGYEEFPAKINDANLILTRRYANRICKSSGFNFLQFGVSHKHVPNGFGIYGGQHAIVMRKP